MFLLFQQYLRSSAFLVRDILFIYLIRDQVVSNNNEYKYNLINEIKTKSTIIDNWK